MRSRSSRLLKDLTQFIAKMQKRGRFSRFILANADLMTLKKLRHQMEDTVSSFQVSPWIRSTISGSLLTPMTI